MFPFHEGSFPNLCVVEIIATPRPDPAQVRVTAEEHFAGKSNDPSLPELVMDKALQRHHDRNRCIQKFCLQMFGFGFMFRYDTEFKSIFEMWMPIVFESKSIRKISVEGFRIKSIGVLRSKHLETFSLKGVEIVDEDEDESKDNGEKPVFGRNVVNSDIKLKSLYLDNVLLSSDWFECLSLNCPSLETLHLLDCFGFEEIKLSSSSIRHLRMEGMVDGTIKRAVIDAPNLVQFEYESDVPKHIYFKTIASECKSKIVVRSLVEFDYDALSWCRKLYGFLQALSESEISIDIFQDRGWDHEDNTDMEEEDEEGMESESDDTYGSFFYGPVEVENLHLSLIGHSETSSSDLIINLFRLCHPRNIDQFWYFDPKSGYEKQENQIIEFMSKTLLLERERRDYLWQQDLEEVSMEQVSDDEDRDEVCFRLKWKFS